MAKINLDKLSLKELQQLSKDVDAAIVAARKANRKAAIDAANKAAAKHGFTLDELSGKAKTSAKTPAPAKYAHPDNPSATWSGRGRQPNWIKEALAAGKSLDDFLI